MKIFVSSEMNTHEDMAQRRAAIEEIGQLSHEAVCFEKLPGRPLPSVQGVKEKCLEMVRNSDLVIVIVDDTVTEVMGAEINEAYKHLGSSRIFLYFTQGGKRDGKAEALRDSSKKSHILKYFESPDQLKLEIARSIASYLDDAFSKPSEKSDILLLEKVQLQSGGQRIWKFDMHKGETVTVSCIGNSPFHAGFYSREEFFRRRSAGWLDTFNFGNKKERKEYTDRIRIKEGDDYYFILRATYVPLLPLVLSTTSVAIEIKRVLK
jgi:hypothetical protein